MKHWSYATLALALVWFTHPFAVAQEATTPPITPADESQAIAPMVIVDQRDERVRRNFALSGNMFDCANAIWNLGDDRVAADRLTRLEATVRGAMGSAAAEQQLIVERVLQRARVRGESIDGERGIDRDHDVDSPT